MVRTPLRARSDGGNATLVHRGAVQAPTGYRFRESDNGDTARTDDRFRRGPIASPTRRLVIASKQRAPRVDCGGEESAAMEGAAGQLGRSERTAREARAFAAVGTPQNRLSRGCRTGSGRSEEPRGGEKMGRELGY